MSPDIEEAITTIRKKISTRRALFSNGQGAESNVVDNIIYPVLSSLGWTDGDNLILREFEVKLRRKKGRADLVLSKGQDKHILAVEAKKLGEKVDGSTQTSEDHIEQLIEYLVSLKREFGILTDGEWWHLIQRDGYAWKTIWITNLLVDDLADIVHTFTNINPENSEKLSDQIKLEKKKKDVLEREWAKIVKDRDLQIKIFTDLLIKQVRSNYEDISIEPFEIIQFLKANYNGLTSPQDIPIIDDDSIPIDQGSGPTRPPSGSQITIQGKNFVIRSYRDIVYHTGEWLAAKGKLNQDVLNRQRKLFPSRKPILVKASNIEIAKSAMKIGRIRPLKNVRGWFVDVNFRPWNCWVRAQNLLDMARIEGTILVANDILAKDLERKK